MGIIAEYIKQEEYKTHLADEFMKDIRKRWDNIEGPIIHRGPPRPGDCPYCNGTGREGVQLRSPRAPTHERHHEQDKHDRQARAYGVLSRLPVIERGPSSYLRRTINHGKSI